MMVLLVFIQILYVTMVYGPIAAFLVELFPTRIRYTSMSLPYHIGNGIFGGLTPFIATRLFDASKTAENPGGDPYIGLFYPMLIAGVCCIIGLLYLPSKNGEAGNAGSRLFAREVINQIKRFAGFLWIALGAVAIWLMFSTANAEIAVAEASRKAVLDTRMFWYVIIPIFTPIMLGLCLFGWYAWKGEFGGADE
jgi:hypothetical protein